MKYLIIIVLCYGFCASESSHAQVTLSPEIGITYSPYTVIYGKYEARKAGLIFGISGDIPFHKKWSVNTRLSYNKMESSHWTDCEFGWCEDNRFKHDNINMDLKLFYKFTPIIRVGLGPTIIKKLKAIHTINGRGNDGSSNAKEFNYNINQYGIAGGISFDFKYVILHLDYMRKINAGYLIGIFGWPVESRHRLNVTLAAPIRSSKNK